MISELARGDWEDLKAQGLSPTLEDFDRLNSLAIRLTDGAETTAANFPRIGWAGDVPFYEPTVQAVTWYCEFAVRCAANEETLNTFWAFALAHARTPGFFTNLDSPDAISRAVQKWALTLPVSKNEVFRACRFASRGFDRGNLSEASRNLQALDVIITRACAKLGVAPDALVCETSSRLERICAALDIDAGVMPSSNEAQLRAEYSLALREIVRRLKKEGGAS